MNMNAQIPQPPQDLGEVYDIWYTPWWRTTWGYGILALSGLICVLCIFWVFKKYMPKKEEKPEIKAYKALAKLTHKDFKMFDDYKIAYTQLVSILKIYVQERYNVSALSETDNSFLQILPVEKALIEPLVQRAQFIKFDDMHRNAALSREQVLADIAQAQLFVKHTTPSA